MALKQPIIPSGVLSSTDWISTAYSTTSGPPPSYPNAVKAIASWKTKEEEARNVLNTSFNFNDIYLVLRFFRFQNPDTAVEVLSGRWKYVLDSWLNILHGNRRWKLSCDCNDVSDRCKASDIVSMCRQRPAPVWDGEWIFSDMDSTIDVATIAQKLDYSICSVFCAIPYESWFYRDDVVSTLLDRIRNFRDRCAQYLQNLDRSTDKWKTDKWELLAQASPPSLPMRGQIANLCDRKWKIETLWRIG